jgi:hypothetical protein
MWIPFDIDLELLHTTLVVDTVLIAGRQNAFVSEMNEHTEKNALFASSLLLILFTSDLDHPE